MGERHLPCHPPSFSIRPHALKSSCFAFWVSLVVSGLWHYAKYFAAQVALETVADPEKPSNPAQAIAAPQLQTPSFMLLGDAPLSGIVPVWYPLAPSPPPPSPPRHCKDGRVNGHMTCVLCMKPKHPPTSVHSSLPPPRPPLPTLHPESQFRAVYPNPHPSARPTSGTLLPPASST